MTLVGLTINEFVNKVAGDSATPGGGSVAALAGSLGAALCAMVAGLTLGRKRYQDVWKGMERIRDSADELAKRLQELVDEDTEAYNRVMAAYRMPKEEEDQKAARHQAIQDATKQAARVPMETLKSLAELVDLVGETLDKGNPNCLADAGVAAQLIRAAAMGAAYNVRINLSGIVDEEFSSRLEREVAQLLPLITKEVERLAGTVESKMGSEPFNSSG